MAMEFGSVKKNRCGMSGCPWTAHLLCFGTVKKSPNLYEMDQKRPCFGCMKLFELKGCVIWKLIG